MSGNPGFGPKIDTIARAERLVTRGLSLGGVVMCVGGILKLAFWSSSLGLCTFCLGVAILLGTFISIALANRYSTIKKDCPRCSKPNSIFPREAYFKCSSCGYFAILNER